MSTPPAKSTAPGSRRLLLTIVVVVGIFALIVAIVSLRRPDVEAKEDAQARADFAARGARPPEPALPADQASVQDLIRGYWAKSVVIVDARDATAFQKSHIGGAILSTDVSAIIKAAGPQRKPIIIYGQDTSDVSPARAADTLRTLGLPSVRVCAAGLQGWQASNSPVVRP